MASPQGQYLAQGQAAEDGFAQHQEQYAATSPPGTSQGPNQAAGAPGRKKRAYAGQAYEFGAGANSALGGQQQGAAPAAGYPGFSQQQDAAGYPQGGYQQNPAAVQPGQPPMYSSQDGVGVGGYQPPAASYPTGQAVPSQGVANMTQQFGQIDMSQKPAQAPAQRAPTLNQLYPTDLLNAPFNVTELEYPPPPAILPPNVSNIFFAHAN